MLEPATKTSRMSIRGILVGCVALVTLVALGYWNNVVPKRTDPVGIREDFQGDTKQVTAERDCSKASHVAVLKKMGKTCVVHCMPSSAFSVLNLLNNPDDCADKSKEYTNVHWLYEGSKSQKYCDGCTSVRCAELGPSCTQVGHYGDCTLHKYPAKACKFTDFSSLVDAEMNVAASVTKAVQTNTELPMWYLNSQLDSARGARTKWNQEMQSVDGGFASLKTCITYPFVMNVDATLKSELDKVQANLAKAGQGSATTRISTIHEPNVAACEKVRARILERKINTNGNADIVLPVAFRAMALCTAAYAEAGVDYLSAKKSFTASQMKFRSVVATIFEHTATAIRLIEDYFGQPKHCGFFAANEYWMCEKVKELRTKILQPVGRIAMTLFVHCVSMPSTIIDGVDLGMTDQATAEDCRVKCANNDKCGCYTYYKKYKKCGLLSDPKCSGIEGTTSTEVEAGICKDHGAIAVMIYANEVRPKCEEVSSTCEKDEKCLGLTEECEPIEAVDDVASVKVAKVMLKDAHLSSSQRMRVDRSRLASPDKVVVVANEGGCLATCVSMGSECVAVDVKKVGADKAECYVYHREERPNLVLVEDDQFVHYDLLRQAHVSARGDSAFPRYRCPL